MESARCLASKAACSSFEGAGRPIAAALADDDELGCCCPPGIIAGGLAMGCMLDELGANDAFGGWPGTRGNCAVGTDPAS